MNAEWRDLEDEIAELRRSLPPPTSDDLLEWSRRAAAVISRELPGAEAALEGPADPTSGDADGSGWSMVVTYAGAELVTFRADGTWTESSGVTNAWTNMLEGSPEDVGRYLARRVRESRQEL